MRFSISDYDFDLPKSLIAQYPLEERDACRLLVLNRKDGSIRHSKFKDVIDFMEKGDLLVLNDTRVISCRLFGVCKETKGKVEVLILEKKDNFTYKVLLKPKRRLKLGKRFLFDNRIEAEVVDLNERLLRFNIDNLEEELERIGDVPLPPYIKRRPDAKDKENYQTVYAKSGASLASPTAGLHFTKELLERISSKGVNISYITLNIGYSTFSPIRVSDIRSHSMHKEYFRVPSRTYQLIYKTKSEGKRIFGVGTTVVRCLETLSSELKDLKTQDYEGYTDLFIYPGYKFNIIDCLITNFHLPRSTLLILTCAFAGRELIMKAYQEAIVRNYRFYSYGDCMLIL